MLVLLDLLLLVWVGSVEVVAGGWVEGFWA